MSALSRLLIDGADRCRERQQDGNASIHRRRTTPPIGGVCHDERVQEMIKAAVEQGQAFQLDLVQAVAGAMTDVADRLDRMKQHIDKLEASLERLSQHHQRMPTADDVMGRWQRLQSH
jgi:hypothetical protein